MDATSLPSQRRPFSVKLWPPSENTRQMLVERIRKNLTSESIFTNKYGKMSLEEAEESAKRIEDEAFSAASQHYEKEPDGDGGSAVQLYAKECSKLVVEVLKEGPKRQEAEDLPSENGAVVAPQEEDLPEQNGVAVAPREEDLPEENGVVVAPQEEDMPAENDVVVARQGEDLPVESGVIVAQETLFDISRGQRAFIEAEEAKELLEPLKEPTNAYTKICFSNRSFGLDAARVAEPILLSLKDQLKEVDLSDFIAGRPEMEALEVMKIFSAALEGSILKSLDLSNNALGEKGVRAFSSLLRSQSQLEELYLMNDGISEEAACAVSELIPSTKKLKVLHFHNNMTGDEGALAIAEVVKRSPLLEDFRCSSTRIGSDGGVALAEALSNCVHLRKLDLRDNMFGVEGGVALSKALSKHSGLTEVYLSYLNLEDEGAIAIVDVLREKAPSLEVLEMAGNDITAEAAPALAACVASMDSIAKLNLSENELKDEGTIRVAKALEEGHEKLEEVDFNTNSIRRAGARCLAQVVVQKAGFKLLNINGNFISDEGVDDVKSIFKKCPEMLASLDENDPDGGDEDDEEGEENGDDGDELESKLKDLDVGEEN